MEPQKQHLQGQSAGWGIIQTWSQQLELGMSEREGLQLLEKILAENKISKIWHPTCVKFDRSTLKPGVNHKASEDTYLTEIALADIGVVVDGLEIDCGQSFGFTKRSQKLALSSENIFRQVKTLILEEELKNPANAYAKICQLAKQLGYQQIAPTGGHLLGPYPHPKKSPKISPTETAETFAPGGWMIEVHISDGELGAFFEDFVWVRP